MSDYRVWISPHEYVDIEAECQSRAVEEVGRRWIWMITKPEGGSNGSNGRN